MFACTVHFHLKVTEIRFSFCIKYYLLGISISTNTIKKKKSISGTHPQYEILGIEISNVSIVQ